MRRCRVPRREQHWRECLGLGCYWHCSRRPTGHWHSRLCWVADSAVVVAAGAEMCRTRLQEGDTQHMAGTECTAVAVEEEEEVGLPGRDSHMGIQT